MIFHVISASNNKNDRLKKEEKKKKEKCNFFVVENLIKRKGKKLKKICWKGKITLSKIEGNEDKNKRSF